MAIAKINGINIYHEDEGKDGGKGTVMFLNGVAASVSSWMFQAQLLLKAGYRVVLHDLRGQLLSEKPDGIYSFELHASDAKALLEYLGIREKVHVVGTSYGGEVAMRFALQHADSTRSLTLIDSASEIDALLRTFIALWSSLAKKETAKEFFLGLMPSVYGEPFLRMHYDTLMARAETAGDIPADFFDGQRRLYDTFSKKLDCTAELNQIRCPTLVVCGENDVLKPRKFSKILADNIAGSEYVLIPGSGHATLMEKPNEINSLLLGFIAKNTP